MYVKFSQGMHVAEISDPLTPIPQSTKWFSA